MMKSTLSVPEVLATLDSRSQRAIHAHTQRMIHEISTFLGSEVRLTDADRIRTLRWLSWAQHFDVPVHTILTHTFTWGRGVASAKIKFRRRVNLFPLPVASLTGQAAFAYVDSHVGNGGTTGSVEALRDAMLSDAMASLPEVTVSKPLDYPTPAEFSDNYVSQMETRRKGIASAEETLAGTRPFRNNPFK